MPWTVDNRAPPHETYPRERYLEAIDGHRAALVAETNQERRSRRSMHLVSLLDQFSLQRRLDCEEALVAERTIDVDAAREDFLRGQREANNFAIEFLSSWTTREDVSPILEYWIAVRAYVLGDYDVSLEYFDRVIGKLTPSHRFWVRAHVNAAKVALLLGADDVESKLEGIEMPSKNEPFERWLPRTQGYAVSQCIRAERAEARGATEEALRLHREFLYWLGKTGFFGSKDDLRKLSERAVRRLSL